MEDRPSWPPGLIEIAIEPKTKADKERMLGGIARLIQLDPSFSMTTDEESGQTILKGLSERHLDKKIDALRRTYKAEINAGAPQVAYRETISAAATIDYTHKKQTGGSGQFARVKIAFEPLTPGSGFVFENAIAGGAIPAAFVPGVEKGLMAQKESGLLAGFPLIDFKATLLDGAFHDIDSNALTFEIAARAALRELAQKGQPRLLEPVMNVAITATRSHAVALIEDLEIKRGSDLTAAFEGPTVRISGAVPLANMFGFNKTLSELAGAEGSYDMSYARYAIVPQNVTTDDDPRFPGAAAMRAPIAANDLPF